MKPRTIEQFRQMHPRTIEQFRQMHPSVTKAWNNMKPETKTTDPTSDTQPIRPLPGMGFTVITVSSEIEDWTLSNSADKHNHMPRSITTRRVRLCNFIATNPERVATTRFTLAVDYDQTVYEARTGIMLYNMGDYLSSPALDKARKPEHTVRMVAASFELYMLSYAENQFGEPMNYVRAARYFRAYNTVNNLSSSLPQDVWKVRVVMDVDGNIGEACDTYDVKGTDCIKRLKNQNMLAWWSLYKLDDNGCYEWKADATTLEAMRLVWVVHTMTNPDVVQDMCSQDITLEPHVVRGEG